MDAFILNGQAKYFSNSKTRRFNIFAPQSATGAEAVKHTKRITIYWALQHAQTRTVSIARVAYPANSDGKPTQKSVTRTSAESKPQSTMRRVRNGRRYSACHAMKLSCKPRTPNEKNSSLLGTMHYRHKWFHQNWQAEPWREAATWAMTGSGRKWYKNCFTARNCAQDSRSSPFRARTRKCAHFVKYHRPCCMGKKVWLLPETIKRFNCSVL